MRKQKKILCLVLALALMLGLALPAAAVGEEAPAPSDPLTREELCMRAARCLAQWQDCDQQCMIEALLYHKATIGGPYETVQAVFYDCDPMNGGNAHTITALACLGVVKGRGGGRFDGRASITRQEAAVLLDRLYRLCGGPLSEPSGSTLADQEAVADWAQDSVTAMVACGIMELDGEGRFAPQALYTRQDCEDALNALSGRLPEEHVPLLTYDQYLEHIDWENDRAHRLNCGTVKYLQVDGPLASFVKVREGDGTMSAINRFRMVYRDGRIKTIPTLDAYDSALDRYAGTLDPESVRFSEDGARLTCTVTVDRDTNSFEAGVYQHDIAVETLKDRVTKQ